MSPLSVEQLTLDFDALQRAEGDSLFSPWCEVSAELLNAVWSRLSAKAAGKERLDVPVTDDEGLEIGKYPCGWAIIATRSKNNGMMGSSMSQATLERLLRAFLKTHSTQLQLITL